MTHPDSKNDRSISTFSELLGVWWSQRWSIFLKIGMGALVTMGVLVAMIFLRPSQREMQLDFRVLFTGVDQSIYPNGARFTPADVISESVLRSVYDKNGLQASVKFEEFRSAFAVLPRNPALEEFRRSFRARLDDASLNQVERTKVEDEYESRVRALRNGEFTLIARPAEVWSGKLTPAMMSDILTEWSLQIKNRGVFKLDYSIYSANIVTDSEVYQGDYLFMLDRIRVTIDRILENIDQLEAIPGMALVRAGPKQLSLQELKTMLRFDLRYRLAQLEVPVYGLGLYKNQAFSEAYINDRLFYLNLDAMSAKSRIASVEDALARYTASSIARTNESTSDGRLSAGTGNSIMPQLSESFLNRMLDLANVQQDLTFRQELSRRPIELGKTLANIESERQVYNNIIRQLHSRDSKMEPKRAELLEWVQVQSASLVDALKGALDNAQALHEEISRRNLDGTQIYSTPEPVKYQKVSSVGLGRIMMMLALSGGVYACIVLLGAASNVKKLGVSA